MPAPETRFAVLLFTDIVGSTELKARHGVPAYSEALRAHNGHFERIAHECLNIRTLQSRGDGYFAEAGSIAEAVRFALLFEEAMREGPWGEVRLAVRVGIHAGEIGMLNQEDGTWIVGPAADLAARITDLAMGGQILLTRFPFDEARHFIREHPSVAGKAMPPLCWLAHGPYLLKGRDEPMDIFEVGAEGLAPLIAPPDGDKAKRAIRPGEEETLGWRPAVGLEIPGRTGWHLTEKLGAGGFGEVWTGEHSKLHQRRAFKFCFDDERLRALKREVTLVRLLRSALGERDDIVHIHELKLDAPPFYLESDLAPHGNLLQWAESQGGLDKIPLAQRIALVAHTATALAAAHSIGVLHKDIKPTNILIFDGPGGEPRPRLVDFGIGTLADPAVLKDFGVTAAGFTRATIQHSTGTPTYSPPEYLAGKPYTIQGDIYGLGVLLYQLITVKPLDPLAQGWERDIADPLLREDIAACVDGDPARRLPSAADLAERLLHLGQRRDEIVESERLSCEAAARAEGKAAMLAAEGKLRSGDAPAALAHLAEAVTYDSTSTLAAENASVALNEWGIAFQVAICHGHECGLWSAQLSPDGQCIVTASVDKTARVWEASSGKELAILKGHAGSVRSAHFSPDGQRIITASEDETARVWKTLTGELVATLFGHEDCVRRAQFSADGRRIVTASSDKTARVWDAWSGRLLVTLSGHKDRVLSSQFSPDGEYVISVSGDKTAKLWKAFSGELLATLIGHEGTVRSAHFSPDGLGVVTASDDQTARVWKVVGGRLLATLKGHGGTVRSAHFSPDGCRLITASWDRTARVWEMPRAELTVTISEHGDFVAGARFSRDGKRIVTVPRVEPLYLIETRSVWPRRMALRSRQTRGILSQVLLRIRGAVKASRDETAQLWEASSGKLLATLTGHRGIVHCAQFSPDGLRVVTASDDKTARVWKVEEGKLLATLSGHEDRVRSAQFSPDGLCVVTASDDKTARVWKVENGKLLATLSGHEDSVRRAQFSPDGQRVVTASEDTTARVWEVETGKLLNTLSGHQDCVWSAQFSPDGQRLATTSQFKCMRLWDVQTGTLLATLLIPGHHDLCLFGTPVLYADGVSGAQFSPDGECIVTVAEDQTARVWKVPSGELVATLVEYRANVNDAQFSPDGQRIITAARDGTVRLWDPSNGKLVATLTLDEDDPVRSVQLSSDGQSFVTASGYGSVRVWTILPASAGPPPVWFPCFLRYVAQMRLNSDGELETLKPDDWLALRERMRAVLRAGAGHDRPYLRILRRFVPE